MAKEGSKTINNNHTAVGELPTLIFEKKESAADMVVKTLKFQASGFTSEEARSNFDHAMARYIKELEGGN